MWLVTLIRKNKWIVVLALVALAASAYGIAYLRGWTAHETKTEQKELKQAVQTAQATVATMEAQQSENAATSKQYAEATRRDGDAYRTIRTQARAATESGAITTTAGSGPAMCVVTREFVRLWDAALAVPHAATGAVIAAASAGDIAADQGSEVAHVSAADVLDNHIENAERAAANWQQCTALIEWHHRNDKNGSAR